MEQLDLFKPRMERLFVHDAIVEALDSKCDDSIKVSVVRSYTLNIKGHVITLNEDEVEDLIDKLESL